MDSANNVTKVEAGVKNEAVDTNKVETLVGDQTVTKEVQEPKEAEASEAKNAVEIGVGDASEVKNADDLVSDDSEDSKDMSMHSSDFHTSDFNSFTSTEGDTGNSEDEVNVNVPNPNLAGDGPNHNKDKPPSTEAPAPKPRVEALWIPLVPSVTTTGNGPNGKKIYGLLYKYYLTRDVSIMCYCHGEKFSPAEFVVHAGGIDIPNPLKHINVLPFNHFP